MQFGNIAMAGQKEIQRNSPEILVGVTRTTSKRVDTVRMGLMEEMTFVQQKATIVQSVTSGTLSQRCVSPRQVSKSNGAEPR